MPEPGKTSKTSSSAMDVEPESPKDFGVSKLSLGPGKGSNIHDRFGVVGETSTATGATKRKRGASDGASEGAAPAPVTKEKRSRTKKAPAGKGKQRAAQTDADNEVADPNAFKFRIRMTAPGSFAGDKTGHVDNQVATQPDPGGPKPGNAYVGNVITVARGKDKTPAQVAEQYAAEAFDDKTQAKNRFALVVGVNSMESVLSPQAGQTTQLDGAVATAKDFKGFPLTAFRRQWRPTWEYATGTQAGQEVPIETVRRDIGAHTVAAADEEKEAKKNLAPVGPMRTETRMDSNTLAYQNALKRRYQSVYVHVGDADAVNLKAPPEPGAPASGLFDRYDDVIRDAKRGDPNAKGPQLISGGYKFRVDNKFLPEGQKHDDPHAKDAGRVSPQTAAGSELDMSLRESIATVDPSKVYLPEPNMLIRGDVYQHANFGPTNKDESKHAAASIARADGQRIPSGSTTLPENWAKQNVVLDTRAALYTDGTRFDEEMSNDITRDAKGNIKSKKLNDYGRGKTDIDGLTATSNLQSHARIRTLVNIIARMNSNILPLLEVYLPQKVTALENEKSRGAAKPETLDALRTYFSLFDGIASEMEKSIRELRENADIPARLQKKDLPGASGAAKDKQFKEQVAAQDASTAKDHAHLAAPHAEKHQGLADAAKISLDDLSAKLVVASAAAKNFQGKQLNEVLSMCRMAGNAIGKFLSTYRLQDPTFDPAAQAAPTQVPSTSSTPVASSSNPPGHTPMQVDPPSPRA